MIGNLRSRRTAELFAQAQRELERRGLCILEAHATYDGRAFGDRVRHAVREGHALVLAGGGDGSLTSIVGAFAHTQSVLGVLPFGTGNSFARSLGIGPGLAGALEVILEGRVAEVDLGMVNDRYFANVATIGLSSAVARRTPNWLKKVFGPAAYVLAGLYPLLRSKSFEAAIATEDKRLCVRTHQVVIANGRYFGLTPLLPAATLVDGKLAFYATRGLNRWEVARMFFALGCGAGTRLPDAEFFSAASIDVDAQPPQYLDADGEALGRTPARFSVARRALKVMVPHDFTGT